MPVRTFRRASRQACSSPSASGNPERFDDTQSSITPGFEECGYNVMSADEFQNPVFATNSYRAFTVKIEKSTRPERIWIESEQFAPGRLPALRDEPVTKEVF